jgi:diadenosine tetraphosphate (Ap4A) HIT family hydrolase
MECLICQQIAGDVELPGGLLVDEELVAGFHVPPRDPPADHYLGHLLVVSRRHVDHFADLSASEAAAVMAAAHRLSQALRDVRDPERIHLAVVGLGVPHFHLHVFPRYRGTPPDVSWLAADEWEGAPRGTPAEIAATADELRSRL